MKQCSVQHFFIYLSRVSCKIRALTLKFVKFADGVKRNALSSV